MNLQYLRYALEVEKAGSISKAAENLFMNQPNLSKAIKELEAMIGVTLFMRTTKGVSSVTEDGRVFIEYAKNILFQLDDMKAHFQAAGAKRDTFRLSIPRASYIAEAFTAFIDGLSGAGGFCVSFQETNSMMAINSVVRDGYDLGVIRYRAQYEKYFLSLLQEEGLEHREVLKADSVIIMSAQNALAGKPVLALSDLSDMIEITNDDFAMPRHLSRLSQQPHGADGANGAGGANGASGANGADGAPQSGKRIFVFERGSQFDLLARIPKTFMWVSPMPRDVLARNALVQKSCAARDIGFKDVLIYRRGHAFGALERAFLDSLERAKNTILLGKSAP
ncbi:MAG: LysR family transcriptional regulator [Clostridiales bacterium]|jgi:DNA-binding transcriptional LysR family regulator|nr:LysR family transcriptional regulator [Clostridiales bacterium]